MAVNGLTAARELRLSELAPRKMQSEIRAISVECDRIGGVNLAQGVCDTEPPAAVLSGAIAAIHAGHNMYTRMDGIARLREAIAAKMLRDRGLVIDPDREILVTSGATGGLNAAVAALLDYAAHKAIRPVMPDPGAGKQFVLPAALEDVW